MERGQRCSLGISMSNRVSDDPAGRPRNPLERAVCTNDHVSPGISGIGPELRPGHLPVRAWKASAHARIKGMVGRGATRAF